MQEIEKKKSGTAERGGQHVQRPWNKKDLTTELEARGEIEKSLGGYRWQSS